MAKHERHSVQVVSHGPSCLDGVTAAAAVARFYPGHRVITTLAANGDSDRVIQQLRLRAGGAGDEIWITDLSWTTVETAAHLAALAHEGAQIYWIDHHRTAVARPDAPEFNVPFKAKVLSEQYSAARLTFNFLKRRVQRLPAATRPAGFEEFYPFVAIADDHDRWIHHIPGSADWALAVQTLGGAQSYREMLKLSEPIMSRRLRAALQSGRNAMDKSFELAINTLVERELANGLRIRTACCAGYSSEVAARLYEGQQRTVIALFDLRSFGVSLRRSADCDVDLSWLAARFGGGGHAAAAGFMVANLKQTPAEKLSEIVGEKLEGSWESRQANGV